MVDTYVFPCSLFKNYLFFNWRIIALQNPFSLYFICTCGVFHRAPDHIKAFFICNLLPPRRKNQQSPFFCCCFFFFFKAPTFFFILLYGLFFGHSPWHVGTVSFLKSPGYPQKCRSVNLPGGSSYQVICMYWSFRLMYMSIPGTLTKP